MACPSDAELLLLLASPTPPPHLTTCATCQERVRHLRAQRTMDLGSGEAGASSESLPEPGVMVGPYRVLAELGRGGMGVVYTAYHPVLDRQVALKLPGRPRVGEPLMERVREAQAMARVSHPNVVQVHDAGVWRGQVYLVMERVQGETLSSWLAREPRPWRRVLEVLLGAGHGIEAAHAAGVVHRDFKPENVLVEASGRARVTDFGLARAFESSLPPAPGAPSAPPTDLARTFAGTPAYVAPEQLAGAPPDPKSDQFSFCVTAWEALAGARPFPTTELYLSGGASPPIFRGASVPRRIVRVLRRGLSVDPQERYRDMTELLQALAVSRVRRAVGMTVGLSMIAVLGLLAWDYQERQASTCRAFRTASERVWGADSRSRAHQAFLATGRPWAEVTWRNVDRSVAGYAEAWSAHRSEACLLGQKGQANAVQLASRVTCLDRRYEELEALVRLLSEAQGDVVDNAARAVGRLSPLSQCSNLAVLDDPLLPPESEPQRVELRRALAEVRVQAGAGRQKSARAALLALVEQARRLGDRALEQAGTLALGEVEVALDDPEGARREFERAALLALARRDDSQAAVALAQQASVVGWRLHRPDEGARLAEWAEVLARRSGAPTQVLALVAESRGDLAWEAGQPEQASSHYREAVELYTLAGGAESLDVLRATDGLAWALMDAGRYSEAERSIRSALAGRQRLLGEHHPATALSWVSLGQLMVLQERFVEALEPIRQAIAIADQAGPDASPPLIPLADLAEAELGAGQLAAAASTAARLSTLATGRGEYLEALDLDRQGQILLAQGKAVEAARCFSSAIDKVEAVIGPDSLRLGTFLEHGARAQLALAAFPKALTLAERAVVRAKPGSLIHREALLTAGRALAGVGRRAEAIATYERVLTLAKSPDWPSSWRARFALAQLLWAEPGDRGRARALAREALVAAERAQSSEGALIRRWLGARGD